MKSARELSLLIYLRYQLEPHWHVSVLHCDNSNNLYEAELEKRRELQKQQGI